ncbi:hypothetical protein J6590_045539 [Homalodisca vitripennis]|nr:hypothetical protein J6590_045539 [Homalodisca vitripennis]
MCGWARPGTGRAQTLVELLNEYRPAYKSYARLGLLEQKEYLLRNAEEHNNRLNECGGGIEESSTVKWKVAYVQTGKYARTMTVSDNIDDNTPNDYDDGCSNDSGKVLIPDSDVSYNAFFTPFPFVVHDDRFYKLDTLYKVGFGMFSEILLQSSTVQISKENKVLKSTAIRNLKIINLLLMLLYLNII